MIKLYSYLFTLRQWFNLPANKEMCKKIASVVGGTLACTTLYPEFTSSSSSKTKPSSFKYYFNVSKVVTASLTLLLIPQVRSLIHRYVIVKIIPDHTLVQLFGRSLNFQGNPVHPRHLLNLLSFGTASFCMATCWKNKESSSLERIALVFLWMTHRTTRHLGNAALKRTIFLIKS